MVQIKIKGNPIHTSGELPKLHSHAPDFTLVGKDLKNVSLKDFEGKKKVITTLPSLDTGTCSLMTKHINDLAKTHPGTMFITVSCDLPFAQDRFCKAEGTNNILTLSMMRDKEFGKSYGLLITDGPLAGILARSILILDEKNQIIYTQLVEEVTQEPVYEEIAKLI